jgi:hypothetical protein
MDFHITVKHINFTSNQYFLANSHYVIFRKENKGKKFQSKAKSISANDLKHIAIDQKIKFRACLLQDLAHRYLERYIPKEKKFIIRQVTEVPGEELYVDCGFIKLPLHIYAMQPSGQDVIVEFIDPTKKASGTVHLIIEHEPRMQVKHILPSVSAALRKLFKKDVARSPLPPSVLQTNKDKLDFLKSQKQDHHRSQKYDDSDDEVSDAEDTLSESDEENENEAEGSRKFNQSFLLANESGKSMQKQESLELGAHIFNEDEFHSAVASPEKPVSGKSVGESVCEDTPRSLMSHSQESVSTMTVSVKDSTTPRSAKLLRKLPGLPEEGGEDSGAEYGEHLEYSLDHNRVPFSPPTGPVAMVPAQTPEEEEWEQPSEEWLMTPVAVNHAAPAVETPAPRGIKIPPPIITDPALMAPPPRELKRAPSASELVPPLQRIPSFTDRKQPPSFKPPVPQLARVPSFHGSSKGPALPDRNLNRSRSEPGGGNSARVLLSMTSDDEAELPVSSRSASSGERPAPAVPVFPAAGRTIKVPVRLSAGDDVPAALSSLQNTPATMQPPKHGHHRSRSAGDIPVDQLHLGQTSMTAGVSVKELRRNFERPPLAKEFSGSTASSRSSLSEEEPGAPRYASISQSNLPPQPRIMFNRADSERSYSTLSTHEHIPKAPANTHGAPTVKLLMPVRLKSSLQEQVAESGYTNSNNHARAQTNDHHMHRAATVPAMMAPVRMTPPEHAPRREYSIAQHHDEYEPHRAHHQPHRTGSVPSMPYSSPPMSQEKANGGYGGHAGHADHHHNLHRTSTAPALSHDVYARELQNVAYGGGSSSAGNYRAEQPYRSPSPSTHVHEHGLHRAGSHMMAPPIRLQSSDYVPPTYERYTHVPSAEPAHHRHHHEETEQRYVGEYAQERSYVADRRAPRGVYA